ISMMLTAQGADHTTGNLFNIETKDKSTEELTVESMKVQALCAAADSMGLCVFGRSVTNINQELIVTALNDALGLDLDIGFYEQVGRETLEMESRFNAAAGFTEDDDELPDFFYAEALPPLDKTARHRAAEVNRVRREWLAAVG
ncbi:MAG: aldehyde ferredoxin oxidoreductase C-terminal domain-containing protein, partial [Rhodospirillaceae bacterium]